MCQAFLPPYALGSIVHKHAVHPFATIGATLTGVPFGGTTVRRRVAIDLSSPIIECVEVGLSDDGRVIIHERRRLVGDDGTTFSHEAIRWYLHGGVAGNDGPPPRAAADRRRHGVGRREVPFSTTGPATVIGPPLPLTSARAVAPFPSTASVDV